MQQLYVYYRVEVAQLAAAVAAVKAVQTHWQARHPQGHLAVLRRPELRDGQVTLMEVLQLPLPDLALAEAETAAAVAPFLAGPRHVERFEPL
ncbi:MAG: DUF4936 family protein [Rubrivivax sp.]